MGTEGLQATGLEGGRGPGPGAPGTAVAAQLRAPKPRAGRPPPLGPGQGFLPQALTVQKDRQGPLLNNNNSNQSQEMEELQGLKEQALQLASHWPEAQLGRDEPG